MLRKEVLTQEQASRRSKAIKPYIDYDFVFGLGMTDGSYDAVARITFNLHDVDLLTTIRTGDHSKTVSSSTSTVEQSSS